ncbi:DUF4163 domain-containing protein [Kaustia mangrovi]|uniref:DUF4163 domain-containing protein n=1 Tax=Kaustia mangrovi TaxID=2593653 RepID=A0A7S8HAX2_9HYPH|nr:DUF4163 domain-containing protein [Kaustia mangrovi]QPC42030.1 DUF4163 domain-containing protein [Kaustia mangrovi]
MAYRCFLTLFLMFAVPAAAHAQDATLGKPEVLTDTSKAAEITIVLPRAARLAPDWYAKLKADAEAEMASFRKQTETEAEEFRKSNPNDELPPFSLLRRYEEQFVSDRVISLLSMSYVFTGGAHGNYAYESLNYDRTAGKTIEADALFEDLGTDSPAMVALRDFVFADLKRQKKERLGDAYDEAEQDSWLKDVDLPFDTLAFVPSGETGKAGGLSLLFAPYTVGPYAEGDYRVVVPQEIFRDYLSADWRETFAGTPDALTEVFDYQRQDGAFLLMKSPLPNATVSSPLMLEGEAPNYFFFEGEASLKLQSPDGTETLATGFVTARRGEEPTGQAVGMMPFSGRIDLPEGTAGELRVVIGQNDPSDGEGGPPAEVGFSVTVE